MLFVRVFARVLYRFAQKRGAFCFRPNDRAFRRGAVFLFDGQVLSRAGVLLYFPLLFYRVFVFIRATEEVFTKDFRSFCREVARFGV